MKPLVLIPGRVRSLPTYLEYFFLRHPGRLEAEATLEAEALDTYDRRWRRDGRTWLRQGRAWSLVSLPSLLPEDRWDGDGPPPAFGLQAPQVIGRLALKVRALSFATPEGREVAGQVVRLRNRPYLILDASSDPSFAVLERDLRADGMSELGAAEAMRVLPDKGPGFAGPALWPPVAPDAPAQAYLRARLADGFRLARQYERGVRDDVDTECLHQHRVHLRRVRALAALGRMWETQPEWVRLKAVLRDLQVRTNRLRDLDVLLLDLPALRQALPWNEGEALEPWAQALRRQRAAEQKAVRTWLASDEYRRLCAEVEALLADLTALGEPWTVADLTGAALRSSARGVRRAQRAVAAEAADEHLHELRIRTKRLRYSLDALEGQAPPAPAKTILSKLKETQEGLGLFQDRSVLLERLKAERSRFRSSRHQGDPLSFGLLIGLLWAQHERERLRARRDAQRLTSRTFRKALEAIHGA